MLHIGTTGSETPFLAENELPENARLTGSPEDEAKAIAESTRLLEEREIKDALEKSARERGTTASGSGGGGASTSGTRTAAAAPAPSTVQASDNFSEETVSDIVSMGFPRERAIAELRSAKGNKTQAVAALFAKSLRY